MRAIHYEQGSNATRQAGNSNLSAHGFAGVKWAFRQLLVLASEHLQQIARDRSFFATGEFLSFFEEAGYHPPARL